MIENSVSNLNTTMSMNMSMIDSEMYGAIVYIIVVILWYSIGLLFLLSMEILGRTEEIEYSARRRTRHLMRDLHDQTKTKEILEELLDKKNRGRLWNIYLGTKWNTTDCLERAENNRIRHLEKQLATIKRNHRLTHETVDPTANDTRFSRSHSEYPPDTAQHSFRTTSMLGRPSSYDQQQIDRWKEIHNLSRPFEPLPWSSRKSMLGKYLRINTKKLFSSPFVRFKRSNTTVSAQNKEQTDRFSFSNQYPKLLRSRTEADLSTFTSTNNERQNPYLSYFHIPSNFPTVFTPQFY